MKIVIFHTDFRIYWPARIKALNDLLSTKDIKLDIIEIAGCGSPYSFAQTKRKDNLSWHILFPSQKIEDLSSNVILKLVSKKLEELNPDVIVAGAIAFPSGALAVRWARKNHKRVIIFDDSRVNDVKRNCIINLIKQSVYNGVDAMFYPAPEWKETGTYWNFKQEQLFYGVDVVDNSFWQKDIEIPQNVTKPYFIFVGRQIKSKNILFLLEAYKDYFTNVSNPYNLVLIGNGPEHNKIISYIENNDIKGVKLFSYMQQKDLIPYLKNAEAFILPSHKETWGLVINEAMACGLPILASKQCGASSTLIQEEINGFTFSSFEIQDLVNKMIIFHQKSTIDKTKMSQASLKIISNWGVDRFAHSLYEAIEYVMKKSEPTLSFLDKFIINNWNGRYRPI